MEKIMNMQVQKTGTSASPAMLRQVQGSVQETKDDFIRLLQQQKESVGQPEKAKDAGKTGDVRAEKKLEEKQTEEPVEEQVEEADPGETPVVDLAQMELQQGILQQTVIQMTEPAAVEQQVMTETGNQTVDTAAVELVQESAEPLPEISAEPQQPKAEPVRADGKQEPVKSGAEPVRTEAKADAVRVEPQGQAAEIPVEEQSGSSAAGQLSQQAQTGAAEKRDVAQGHKEELRNVETDPAAGNQSPTVSMQNTAPVQTERPQEAPRTELREGTHTVKSTVEELPQELGKAVTAGRPGESQVLTVELEPASLGKLTIRLEYEAGRTMVSVMASSPKTLELLNEKASEIASILKEHTGEETVIYTEQPQREQGEDAQEQGSRGGQQQERQQHRQEEQPQADSFLQQLRLGLV